jgi:sigma-54-specific transcriptional regulator
MNNSLIFPHIYGGPSADATEATDVKQEVVTFDNPGDYALSIRATALVFEDPGSRQLYQRLQKLAPSNATVLVIGETGTGKELIARQVHRLSHRAKGPFIAINCAALPENLIESELFGHEKGAFTGAIQQKKGWFEAAQGGTLFLDEVGDLPLSTQVKLLRVLQEREIHRVGSRVATPINVRLIAATNVNLEEAVRSGRFREDLYYRLNVAQLRLSPLRDRPGDIIPLSQHFIRVYQARLSLSGAHLSHEAQQSLLAYPWPGNIRELENVIHHALLVMSQQIILPRDLNLSGFQLSTPANSAPSVPFVSSFATPAAPGLEQALQDIYRHGTEDMFAHIESRVIHSAFEYCQKNQLQTAKLLGVSRNILRHRLKLYGLL